MLKIRTKKVIFILPPKLITIFYYFNYYFFIFLRRPILDLKFPLMLLILIALVAWMEPDDYQGMDVEAVKVCKGA